jgi:NodT family efflux transporter outer membrane factor (OMF) lipoprotein
MPVNSMRPVTLTAMLGLWACALGLGACAVGPNYRPPQAAPPAAFVADTAAPAESPTDRDIAAWWSALNDAELDSLVERAVKSNLDIEIALNRLQQARTYEAVVVGHALPEIDATGAAARGTGTDLTRSRAQQALVSADNATGLQHINTLLGFDAVWELDLFGKFRREIAAAKADAEAARAAREDVLTVVVADVVRAYIDLRGYQVRLGILQRTADLLRDSQNIVATRFQRGITNELDVALARRELASVESQIAPTRAQASASEYTLAVLLGAYPEQLVTELSKPDLIPPMPAGVAPGVPLDLLKRRPDIQQAERELAGATERIGVATANLFPQVSIVGSIGSQTQGLGTVPNISKHIWSFGPAAVWPVLDFGALDAQVEVADYAARVSMAQYRKTVLTAVQQVDTSLGAYLAERDRIEKLGGAIEAGQRAVELANARYDRGLTDFLNVVDAEREFYDLQEQYALAQVAEGEQFVQLYRSLGGGWQNYQSVPPVPVQLPAVVAAFRRILAPESP